MVPGFFVIMLQTFIAKKIAAFMKSRRDKNVNKKTDES